MDLQEIRELIKLIDQTDIAELSLESAGVKVAIKKNSGRQTEFAKEPAPLVPAEKKGNTPDLISVVAPVVGTFYRAPAPDAPPFVQPGDVVQKGQTLCLIEAMKLMNEIKAEAAGKIVEILAENGEPVEYGQPLFYLKPMW